MGKVLVWILLIIFSWGFAFLTYKLATNFTIIFLSGATCLAIVLTISAYFDV